MNSRTLKDAGKSPTIRVRDIPGDLRIKGWNREDIEAQGESVSLDWQSDSVVVAAADDLTLMVPKDAKLYIAANRGDLSLEDLSGAIHVAGGVGRVDMHGLKGQVMMDGSPGTRRSEGEGSREQSASYTQSQEDPIGRHVAERIGRVQERVRERVHRAEERAREINRKLAHPFLGDERRPSATDGIGRSESTGATAAPQAAQEEQLAILNMLREKKITAEEADMLLSALEGRIGESVQGGPDTPAGRK